MVNIESFIKRLEIILEYYSLSASSFADKIGVQRSSMSHLLSGRNKPSLDFMLKIMDVFPEVDLYWLLNGKGSFPKANEAIETKGSASTLVQTATIGATKIDKSTDLPLEKFSTSNHQSEQQHSDTLSNSEIAPPQRPASDIDRIVIFYKNGTFKTYLSQ